MQLKVIDKGPRAVEINVRFLSISICTNANQSSSIQATGDHSNTNCYMFIIHVRHFINLYSFSSLTCVLFLRIGVFGRSIVWPVSKWYFHTMQRIRLHLSIYTLRSNCEMHEKRAFIWECIGSHNGGANIDGHIPKTSMMICKLHEFVHAVYVLRYGNICHMAPSFLDQLLCMLLQGLAFQAYHPYEQQHEYSSLV